jgi:hypothetical protein
MKTKNIGYPLAMIISLSLISRDAHALSLTKDTVYESRFSGTSSSWAIWNDSVSLLNRTSDTVKMKAIIFTVPEGKIAELGMGYGKPYRKDGPVGGAVLHPDRPYDPIWQPGKVIPPGGRVPITGFQMSNCIECPVTEGILATSEMDTLITYVIFDTSVRRDTLVVIGDISKSPSGIGRPYRVREMSKNGPGSRILRFFNLLGQTRLFKNLNPE